MGGLKHPNMGFCHIGKGEMLLREIIFQHNLPSHNTSIIMAANAFVKHVKKALKP